MKNINWMNVVKNGAIIAGVNYVFSEMDFISSLLPSNEIVKVAVPAAAAAIIIELVK